MHIILCSSLAIGVHVAGYALHYPQADAFCGAGVAVLVRAERFNINTVTFSQDIGIVIDGYFHASFKNNAELVAFMAKRHRGDDWKSGEGGMAYQDLVVYQGPVGC